MSAFTQDQFSQIQSWMARIQENDKNIVVILTFSDMKGEVEDLGEVTELGIKCQQRLHCIIRAAFPKNCGKKEFAKLTVLLSNEFVVDAQFLLVIHASDEANNIIKEAFSRIPAENSLFLERPTH